MKERMNSVGKTNGNYFPLVLLLLLTFAALCTQGGASVSSAQGYMIRAVLLEENESGFTVGALYQDPEAAANSADVQAPMQFAKGQGASLSAAFQSLAQNFSVEASYQLCDYVLLSGAYRKDALAAYARAVQNTQQGRYAAKLGYLAQDLETLARLFEQNAQAAQTLLETVTEKSTAAPYLYEVTETMLAMPCYTMREDGSMEPIETTYLLWQNGVAWYGETQTQLYRLVSGGEGACDFVAGEYAFRVGTRVFSWSGSLVGVADAKGVGSVGSLESGESTSDIGNVVSAGNKQQPRTLPTLTVYGVVEGAAPLSRVALANMEAYLRYQINGAPMLLAQIGASKVEVRLISFANLW